jgi:hypothetical protein
VDGPPGIEQIGGFGEKVGASTPSDKCRSLTNAQIAVKDDQHSIFSWLEEKPGAFSRLLRLVLGRKRHGVEATTDARYLNATGIKSSGSVATTGAALVQMRNEQKPCRITSVTRGIGV